MFEHRTEALLPRSKFIGRLLRQACIAAGLVVSALGIGMVGYHHFEKLSWIDSMLNASFILSGMGPVAPIASDGGKIFASVYALFAGVLFLTVAAVLFAPLAHRLIHRFHLNLVAEDEEQR